MGSVTHWIQLAAQGQSVAAQPLWERYFDALVRVARQKFGGRTTPAADEEDAALSAFHTILNGLHQGQFPNLADRDDLWKLLLVATARKVSHSLRDEHRLKRGGGQQLGGEARELALAAAIGDEPTPAFVVEMADACDALLAKLPDADLVQVAKGRLQGMSVQEIADSIGCAPRSVDRKLNLIRRLWEAES